MYNNCEGAEILLLLQAKKLACLVSEMLAKDMRLLGQRQRILLLITQQVG